MHPMPSNGSSDTQFIPYDVSPNTAQKSPTVFPVYAGTDRCSFRYRFRRSSTNLSKVDCTSIVVLLAAWKSICNFRVCSSVAG